MPGDVCRNVASVFDLSASSEPPWCTVLAFRVIVGARFGFRVAGL